MFWNATEAWKGRIYPGISAASAPPPAMNPTTQVWSTMAERSMAIPVMPRRSSGSTLSSKSSRKQPPLLGMDRRPNTAPALLTGVGLPPAHEDAFLQELENKEVQNIINRERKEQLTRKIVTHTRDLPPEPERFAFALLQSEGSALYELSLYHSPVQRKSRGPRLLPRSKSAPVQTKTELQKLSRSLDGSIGHHYHQMGVPRPVSAATKLSQNKRNSIVAEAQPGGIDSATSKTFQNNFKRSSVVLASEANSPQNGGMQMDNDLLMCSGQSLGSLSLGRLGSKVL